MAEKIVPIFRVKDARKTAKWYERLGFEVAGEHQFAADFPMFIFSRKGEVSLFLSEHAGDAPPNSLAYFYVDNLEAIATEFAVEIIEQPWAQEIHLTDPDGNRLRIAQMPSL